MSYDMVAFDPAATSDAGFAAWYDRQIQWEEDHGYSDVAVTTPNLRDFYRALAEAFPPMNGPDAVSDEQFDADPTLADRITDYSIGTTIIYACFRWSAADHATTVFCDLAARHNVAVALISDNPPTPIIRPAVPA